MKKHLIRPDRVRQVPTGFNWVDHRLVRQNYIDRCDCADRAHLQQADLIAYQKPLYQVLSLEQPSQQTSLLSGPRTGQTQSVAQILGQALKGGAV